MLKNIKFYLENETGVDFFGLLSLLIFFLFFSALLVYVFKMKSTEADKIKQIPLEENGTNDKQ